MRERERERERERAREREKKRERESERESEKERQKIKRENERGTREREEKGEREREREHTPDPTNVRFLAWLEAAKRTWCSGCRLTHSQRLKHNCGGSGGHALDLSATASPLAVMFGRW